MSKTQAEREQENLTTAASLATKLADQASYCGVPKHIVRQAMIAAFDERAAQIDAEANAAEAA
ncbi:hypothetical protein ACSMXM_05545 [Pacificimonas sp. ICDLI1SI03]